MERDLKLINFYNVALYMYNINIHIHIQSSSVRGIFFI